MKLKLRNIAGAALVAAGLGVGGSAQAEIVGFSIPGNGSCDVQVIAGGVQLNSCENLTASTGNDLHISVLVSGFTTIEHLDFGAPSAGMPLPFDGTWDAPFGADVASRGTWTAPGFTFLTTRTDILSEITLVGYWTYDGYPIPPAIPEASTYAMMLAGLGLVGGMAARRHKQIG